MDVALWDLKAKLLKTPLFRLLVPTPGCPDLWQWRITNYSDEKMTEQLAGWVSQGIPRVKIKIGKDWGTQEENDLHRVQVARQAIGPATELFVDANGAYAAKQAVRMASKFTEYDVSYFEEPFLPTSSSSWPSFTARFPRTCGRRIRLRPVVFPRHVGGWSGGYFASGCHALPGDHGWLEAAHLAHSFAVPFSAHTAPTIHAQAGCAAPRLAHVEYFFDHVRIEKMFFDGLPRLAKAVFGRTPSGRGLASSSKPLTLKNGGLVDAHW